MYNNVEKILEDQKRTFDEIIYCLTEPGIPKKVLANRLSNIAERVKTFLNDLIKYRESIPSQDSKEMITVFMRDCVTRYEQNLNTVTSSNIATSEEYSAEAAKEARKSSIVPKQILDRKQNQQVAPGVDPLASPTFTTKTASDTEKMFKAAIPNVSWEITMLDGEQIDPTVDEFYFVISPITINGSVHVTKFSSADGLTKYLYDTYKPKSEQPFVIFGKQAQLMYSVSISK